MENDFSEYLSQNWNEKYKAAATLQHLQQQQQQQQSNPKSINYGIDGIGNFNRAAFLNELTNSIQIQCQQQDPLSPPIRGSSDLDLRLAFLQQHQQQSHISAGQQHQLGSLLHRDMVTNAPCPKLIDIKDIRPNVALSTTSPSRTHTDRPMPVKSSTNNLRNAQFPANADGAMGGITASSSIAGHNALFNAMMSGSHSSRLTDDCDKIIDSTASTPTIQCSSSSGNLARVVSTADIEKKAANSIRGILKIIAV